MFNTFLEDLKERLRNKASFWARIKEGTIHSDLYTKPIHLHVLLHDVPSFFSARYL